MRGRIDTKKPVSILIAGLLILITNEAKALPIDWHGIFAVDTTLIDTYKRYEGTSTAGIGPQDLNYPAGNFHNASFQSYKLSLSPTIIINDSVTFNGEMTTGYGYGGRFGDATTNKRTGNFGNALYFYNTSNGNANIVLNKFYAEIFSDTGTFLLGRQPFHWGLGAVYNEGKNTWDRHATIKDGLVSKFKLGNFQITPYYFKTSAGASLTKSTTSKEFGISLLYDNPEKDLAFGILFGKKKNSDYATDLTSVSSPGGIGGANVKITDIHLKKSFSRFSVAAEIPLFSGDVGNALDANTNAKYKAVGIIGRSEFVFNDSWKMGFDLGTLSGDDGVRSSFEAMYLHPNFQIANLMFRYNLNAVANGNNDNIYDSYLTNMKYAKLSTTLEKGSWKWDLALIWAKANETANTGSDFYDHLSNQVATANEDQSDDYGFEVDLGFTYEWNENFHLGGTLGYHFVGDFYKFDNIAGNDLVDIKDTYGLILNAAITF